MRPVLIFSVLCVWIFTGCESKPDLADERENLLETDKQFAALSAREGAADAFFRYMDSTAVQLTSGSPVFGRESIFNRMKPSENKYTVVGTPVRRCIPLWRFGLDMGNVCDDNTLGFQPD